MYIYPSVCCVCISARVKLLQKKKKKKKKKKKENWGKEQEKRETERVERSERTLGEDEPAALKK